MSLSDNKNENKSQTVFKSIALEAAYVPKLIEFPSSSGGWINYGENNDYPEYLNSLASRSPRHSAIIKTKANLIGGEGFKKDNLSTAAISLLKNITNEFDLDEILARISYDLENYGAFALNPIWSKDRSTIAEINYIDPVKVRIAQPILDHPYPNIENYFISDNWKNTFKCKPVFYPGFSTVDRSEASQILYVKQGQDSIDWYGKPSWISAVNWCELDYELAMYHLTNVKNGFSANTIINFNSFPPEEEKDKVVREMRKQYEGVKGNKILFTFSDGKDNAPSINTINPLAGDSTFTDLNDFIQDNIFVAHQIPPAIMGVFMEGKLDNTNNLVEQIATFQKTYVNQKQKLIERVFNKLARINGIEDRLVIEKNNLNLEVKLTVSDIMSVLTSTLSTEQKINVFTASGYTKEQAIALCNNQNHTNQ